MQSVIRHIIGKDIMIKGILFDWVGVLVKEKPNLKERREELYSKLIRKEASCKDVEELVMSFEKYSPLWSSLDELSETYKMCVVNNGPKETMEFWDKHFGYSKYMKFINSGEFGIEKPDVRIYDFACKEIDVSFLNLLGLQKRI